MKVIGTGLSGLVGSRVKELITDFEWVDFSLESGIDILDKDRLKEAFGNHPGAQAVVHLAAFTDTNAAWEQRGDKTGSCYQLNVVGTENIIEFCRQHSLYLLHISTDFLFSGDKTGAYTEEDQPDPIEWYGQTKYWAEEKVAAANITAGIARIAFPFRAYFPAKVDLVRKILAGLESDSLYPMFTDQTITPTFIDDIVGALKKLLEKQSTGVFHVVGSSHVSPYQLARETAEVFGFDKEKVKKGSLAKFQATQEDGRPWQENLALSNEKITQLGTKMQQLAPALQAMKQQR